MVDFAKLDKELAEILGSKKLDPTAVISVKNEAYSINGVLCADMKEFGKYINYAFQNYAPLKYMSFKNRFTPRVFDPIVPVGDNGGFSAILDLGPDITEVMDVSNIRKIVDKMLGDTVITTQGNTIVVGTVDDIMEELKISSASIKTDINIVVFNDGKYNLTRATLCSTVNFQHNGILATFRDQYITNMYIDTLYNDDQLRQYDDFGYVYDEIIKNAAKIVCDTNHEFTRTKYECVKATKRLAYDVLRSVPFLDAMYTDDSMSMDYVHDLYILNQMSIRNTYNTIYVDMTMSHAYSWFSTQISYAYNTIKQYLFKHENPSEATKDLINNIRTHIHYRMGELSSEDILNMEVPIKVMADVVKLFLTHTLQFMKHDAFKDINVLHVKDLIETISGTTHVLYRSPNYNFSGSQIHIPFAGFLTFDIEFAHKLHEAPFGTSETSYLASGIQRVNDLKQTINFSLFSLETDVISRVSPHAFIATLTDCLKVVDKTTTTPVEEKKEEEVSSEE